MDKLAIITYIAGILIIVDCVFTIVRSVRDKSKENIVERFLNVIPIIDKSLKEFAVVYKKAETENNMVELAVDFLYNIIADNTQLDEKYPAMINKDNVEKYVYPLFKKIYAMELKK